MPSEPFADLPAAEAGVILADPPWSFTTYSRKGWSKSPQRHYDCTPLEWIMGLPVRDLANPDGCALAMWATAPMLEMAFGVMRAWGFTPKSAGAWAKQSRSGAKWAFGTGYLYRSAAEFWLLGTLGRPRQTARNVRNLIVAPVREHSRKPDAIRTELQRQFPGPYVELFAREAAPGWISWGNEVGKFDGAA